MKRLRSPGVAGPVGLTFVLAGYSVAVLVARAFVSLIAHCVESCPTIRIEGFHLHHFYYGLALVVLSVAALGFTQGTITRWDSALVFGIGIGLLFDEVGMILLGAHYWDYMSILLILVPAAMLSLGIAYSLRLRGLSDFKILDRSDVLTTFSVLLAVTGFLYFVRPVRIFVATAAVGSWGSAVVLLGIHGRRHLLKIRRGQLPTSQ